MAVSVPCEQPVATSAHSATTATGRRGTRQRTPNPRRYFDAGGVVGAGAGADGVAGSGAGADNGGASRTTDDERPPPRNASENEGSVKMMAMTPGILPSTVGGPIEPNTA